ncbi:taste receptor type 2 member 134 [Phodopus roborovskii]|uniref:Taste receptor type 2 n=1 Tax=Phodopus roborovskii TaxID=109678 RepID=A0AAU9Z7C3_PHORO|nr:taste receptor type 2 member 134 [Phodopus roborovskii]CAH6788619.1 Tas2r134 [Phodopus roborovskii]
MPFSATFIFIVIFCVQSLAAMLQNGFMVAVLGRKWVQSQAFPAGEMIVACLAASRFCLHGLEILNNFLNFILFWHKNNYFGVLWDFINTVNFWFTTWLAIFYCVKICSFSHPIFFWMKWRISQSVPRLLLGSLIIGGLSAISVVTGNTIAFQRMDYENCTHACEARAFHDYYCYHVMLMWVTPFFLFLLSIILLMFSLYWHLEQMRYHSPRPHDYSIQAHTMALKSLAFFLIFYTSYALFLVLSTTQVVTIYNSWRWAWEVITYMGISLHSTILMLSSPKMRRTLKTKFSNLCVGSS